MSEKPRPTDADISAAIARLLDARAPGATICPSEVARALTPDAWRALMPQVREVARRLALRGEVDIRQRGRSVDAAAEWRGPVRLARVNGAHA